MGKRDIITKDYMKDNKIFADAFNFLIYGGRQVIAPEKLHSMDSVQVMIPYGTGGTADFPQGKYRDGLKYLAAMTDDTKAYLILGNENQSEVHYAMPVRNMLYDAMQYASQVEQTAKLHRWTRDGKGHSAGEFLSGFYREDRLIPVITLVICFHGDRWDGPLCIHDMMDFQEEEIRPFVENYHIHLIEPFSIQEEQFDLFQTNLREVLSFLKYSKDRKKLDHLFHENAGFQHLEYKAARVIMQCANVTLTLKEEEGSVNMCKAIEDMKKKEREEGIIIGIREGKREGIKEGIKEGMVMTLCSLVRDGLLSLEEAACRAEMTNGEFEIKMQQ